MQWCDVLLHAIHSINPQNLLKPSCIIISRFIALLSLRRNSTYSALLGNSAYSDSIEVYLICSSVSALSFIISSRSASIDIPIAAFTSANTCVDHITFLVLSFAIRHTPNTKYLQTKHRPLIKTLLGDLVITALMNLFLQFTSKAVKSLWSSMCQG